MLPPLYRLLSLRYLLHRWDRAALIVASIALGVATLVSARILNQCVETAAGETTTPLGGADLYVTNGEAGVVRTLAADLRAAKVPGLKSVQPLVYDRVTLPGQDDRVAVLIGSEVSGQLLRSDNDWKVTVTPSGEGPKFQLIGMWAAARAGDWDDVQARWQRMPDRLAVVSRTIFEERQRRGGAGQPLVVKHGTRPVSCLVVGVIDIAPDSPLAALGKNFIGMEVGQAAKVVRPSATVLTSAVAGGAAEPAWDLHFPPKVNRLDLFLEPGADRDAVGRRVAEVVGSPSMVKTPETQGKSTQEVVSGLQVGFLVCSLGAMIVGLFLVYNAMAVTVAERRPDIGVLRSLGATRGQVIRLFGVAALVLGVIGSALGVPLGVFMAEVTLGQFRVELQSMFLNPEVNPARISWGTAALAALAGVGTAVFAALVPAIQAASDDPADVVRRTTRGAKGWWLVLHKATCGALVLVGLAGILLRDSLPPRVGSIGGMMSVLVGLLLAAPILVGVLIRIVRPLIRAVAGIELRLAADNLTRAPARTGVVIGALGAGVSLMFQTAGVGRSNEEPVVEWLNEVVQADQFVVNGNLTTASSSQSPIEENVTRALAKLPAVDRVMGVRYARPEFNGTIVYLIALDADAFARATRARVPAGQPDLEKFLDLPGTDDVLVSDNFAVRHKVKVGDTVSVPGPSGPVALRIVGTIRDYSWSRGTIFMDRARYAERFGDEFIDIAHVFLKPGHPGGLDAGGEAVKAFAADKGLFVTDRAALRKFLTDLINRVYLLAYLQQIVVGVVAALGVVTALLISVLQRKRELGLLLAVGATPGQVLRSVMAEAVLMGAFGTALGVLIGIPLEWYVLKVVLVDESGFVFDVVLPWKQALGIAAAAMATAAVAGLIPALHAVRTRIPDAIQYE